MKANKFANFVLIVGILCLFIVFTFDIYKIYLNELNSHNFIIAIITISGMLICLFLIYLRQDYKINLVISGLSIIFSIFFVELFLYFYEGTSSELEFVMLAQKQNIPIDTRKSYEVIDDLEEQNIKAVPHFFPSLIIHSNDFLNKKGNKIFPLSGVSQKTTVHCNESGYWSIYNSDEHGFNNPKGIFKSEKIEIMLVGDSFTHGACVKQGEDIGARLREKLGKQIINIGMDGNGPLIELASLKEYGTSLKPKNVLWIYFEGNDMDNLEDEKKSPMLLKYLNPDFSQDLINRQLEVDLVLNEYIQNQRKQLVKKAKVENILNIIRLRRLRNKFGLINLQATPPLVSPSPLFKQILEKAQKLTLSWGGNFYFVYLPAGERYATDVDEGIFDHRNKVLSIVKELHIPIIDIHNKVFMNHPDPLSLFPFRLNIHYTNEGYRLVANAIYQYFNDQYK